MFVCPNLLIIGAASRNVGKTELACEIIRRVAVSREVLGIKVTVVSGSESTCPRGGDGCGVCSSLIESYSITFESNIEGFKDTSRLLRAGAAQVLWLRVRREHLEDGVRALLSRIPEGALAVCESNSIRAVIQPGIFLVVRRTGDETIKPSCAAVWHHADKIVEFDGFGWSLSPENIAAIEDGWVLRPEATAVILAGGESRRMGVDKALLNLGGVPLIQRVADQLAFFPQVLISANDREKFEFLSLPVISDIRLGQGPLMGIASCLAQAAYELSFVTGCDIPRLDVQFILGLLSKAEDYDMVIPRLPDGCAEPMLAVYRRSVVPVAHELLRCGIRSIVALFDRVRVRYVPFEPPSWYANLNTAKDLMDWKDRQKM